MGTRDALEFKLTIQRLTRLDRERKVRCKSKVSSTVSQSVYGARVGKTPGAEGAHAEKEDCFVANRYRQKTPGVEAVQTSLHSSLLYGVLK